MKKHITRSKVSANTYILKDLTKWNFVLFLTIALIVLVYVMSSLTSTDQVTDTRTKADTVCPEISLPNADDCPLDWELIEDENGCPTYYCPGE